MQLSVQSGVLHRRYNPGMSKFYRNLERHMQLAGEDVKDIARIANCSIGAVYKWKKGGDITPNRLKKLADHYKTTPIDLYYGGDAINTEKLIEASELVESLIQKHNKNQLTTRQQIAAIAVVYKSIINEGRADETYILDLLSIAG